MPALGREDRPRIEIDASGRVERLNGLARERLKDHEGLTVSGQRLRANNRAFDAELQAAIEVWTSHLATNLPRGFLNIPEKVVALGEDSQGRPMFCWVFTEQERVLVTFDDDFLLRARLEVAADTFGLSPAQLNLAELLASGKDLTAAADALGVTTNTLRTQLRRMFDKTGAHNQATLISSLLRVQVAG